MKCFWESECRKAKTSECYGCKAIIPIREPEETKQDKTNIVDLDSVKRKRGRGLGR
jgi:hypothetical protein